MTSWLCERKPLHCSLDHRLYLKKKKKRVLKRERERGTIWHSKRKWERQNSHKLVVKVYDPNVLLNKISEDLESCSCFCSLCTLFSPSYDIWEIWVIWPFCNFSQSSSMPRDGRRFTWNKAGPLSSSSSSHPLLFLNFANYNYPYNIYIYI